MSFIFNMKIREFHKIAQEYLGDKIQDWDKNNNSLIIGNWEEEIKKILFCWKVDKEILDYSIKNGFNLIVCHEGVLYDFDGKYTNVKNYLTYSINKKKLERILSNKINILRYHLGLDNSEFGTNSALIDLFSEIIKDYERQDYWFFANLKKEMKVLDLAKFVKEKTEAHYVQVVGDKEKLIKKILVIAGGGAREEFMEFALENGCQALISSDPNAESIYFAYESDLVLINPGHQYLEMWGLKKFMEKLKEKINVEMKFIKNSKKDFILL